MMSSAASASQPCGASTERLVVLLVPSVVGVAADEASLRATLANAPVPPRALLCLVDDTGDRLAKILDEIGVETQILLGPHVKAPATRAFIARALPGTSAKDQTELALALSDLVVVASTSEQTSFTDTVRELGKPMIQPGTALPPLPRATFAHDLDPARQGLWRALGRRVCGRVEQFLLETFAFNWRGWRKGGIGNSLRQMLKCFGCSWGPSPYFAPPSWPDSAPDQSTRLRSSKIISQFNLLDCCALYGSHLHRDLIWLENLGAALAVFAAVMGYLTTTHVKGDFELLTWDQVEFFGWSTVELLTLGLIAFMVIRARRSVLHERWAACRLAAEQLRIALMSMPLLVLPSAFATADVPSTGGGIKEFGFLALSEAKRIVRDHGLPRLDPALTPAQAADWLQLIVKDQITYHRTNHAKLKQAEWTLHWLTRLIFVGAVAAVLAHFFVATKWLLLGTAAAPALAAALHAIWNRLGIADRTRLSDGVERDLKQIDDELTDVKVMPPDEDVWRKIRRLAFRAAGVMGRENTSWHSLVHRLEHEL
jgi:hypothetical protein